MMENNQQRVYLWSRFTLREAVLLCFCATLIILTRAGLRLHLHLPGHVMFFTMFFFLLARGFVPKVGAATLVGLITSLASILLGMGAGGAMVLVKFLLPALVVELAGFVAPAFVTSMIACAVVGVLASLVRAMANTGVEWLLGMDEEIMLKKAMIAALLNGAWGGMGALAVPSIIRRLRVNGLIE
ncbi:hypothetical protein GEOBRER4_n0836 [Citrifermentans bremense]|uniref:Uncharacterized protein n=1 Tax=Citrifermentans bremense TaxID=60035 RepID=A0A6S6M3Y0_9BACT|nr:hypothetical protein [Citrifermentans bremense]BCG46055.1 hypothetical protein GEOBRER4_n0836 [Citrifermentans bremense]